MAEGQYDDGQGGGGQGSWAALPHSAHLEGFSRWNPKYRSALGFRCWAVFFHDGTRNTGVLTEEDGEAQTTALQHPGAHGAGLQVLPARRLAK